jgi:GDPmannose 4,6-dehydratase
MVTRKITRQAAAWARGDATRLKLGNLKARRDWGFAGDYVRAMHAMLQQPAPRDYVVATGTSHSVADFLAAVIAEVKGLPSAADAVGLIPDYVEVDPRLLRTGEIHDLRGNAALARSALGWEPSVDFRGLVRMMVAADIAAAGGRAPGPSAAAAG